jgi:hypothetical protein
MTVLGEKKLASPSAVSTMRIDSGAFPFSYEPNDCSKARAECPVYRRGFGRLCYRRQQQALSVTCEFDGIVGLRPISGTARLHAKSHAQRDDYLSAMPCSRRPCPCARRCGPRPLRQTR